ncbi:MAG: SPOR domain-containing protein [Desulfobacteraceae bacterium]|jgi:hypothetical protein
MTRKKDKEDKGPESFSDSGELFEDIFREAITTEESKEDEKGEGEVEIETTVGKAVSKERASDRRKKTVKGRSKRKKRPEKIKSAPEPKKAKVPSRQKPKKGSGVLRVALLLVLLIVLGAVFVSYYGVEKFGFLPGLLPPNKKKVAQKPVPRTVATKTDTKGGIPAASERAKQTPTTPSKPAPQKRVATVSKSVKQTRTTTPQKPAPQKQVATISKPATTPPRPPRKEPEAAPKRVIVVKKDVRADPPAHAGQVQPQEKSKKRAPAPQKRATSYPYSIYLGSYKSLDRAKIAVSQYQERGLSPYWVKVHLGKKGVWFRVFEGHFEKKGEAKAFISAEQLKDASVKRTKYTNLIGVYSTEQELRTKSLALLELGYCPYAIAGADGQIWLYTGAFLTREGAEVQHRELASKGVQNRLVVR